MSLKIGEQAPDFTLQNSEGKEVRLSHFRGKKKIVLLFFPLAFTSTCTTELCKTRDNMKLYEELKAEILAISVDSFFVLQEFKKSLNLNFTLLSDFNKEVSRDYDVLYDDYYGMKGVSKRAAFVIDKRGKVSYAEVLEDAGELPSFENIYKALQ